MQIYDFPKNFDLENNIFQIIIKRIENEIDLKSLNIDLYGCYPLEKLVNKSALYISSKFSEKSMTRWLEHQHGINNLRNKKNFNIWYTFENRRPSIENFDLTISFDTENFDSRNFYFPLIWLYTCISNTSPIAPHHKITMQECSLPRNLNSDIIDSKIGFASSFINNPQPYRIAAINKLEKIGEISKYGRSVGRYVQDKISTANQYLFNICFENDLYPGYVTEKVLEAWIAKTIPIYWGMDKNDILNPKAIVNLYDFQNLNDFCEYIYELKKDENRLLEMLNQPLLQKTLDTEELYRFILNGLLRKFDQLLP
jgi:hypothetical protein